MPFMAALVYLGFLITAIYAISKSSDLLIDIASCLGRKLHLKDYFIGSLIVGVGTSLPELMTSLAAVGEGAAELVAPTIYGTIIANIGAGLGLAVIGLYCFVSRGGKIRIVDLSSPYGGGAVSLGSMKEDTGNDPFGTPLVFATFSVLLSYLLCLDGIFSRLDAGLFIIGYLAFIVNELVTRSRTSSLVLAKSEPAAAAIATPESTKEKVVAEGKGLLVSDKATWSIAMGAGRILGGPLLAFLVFAVTWRTSPFDRMGTLGLFLLGLLGILVFQALMYRAWILQPRPVSFARYSETVLRQHSKPALVLFLGFTLVVVFFSGAIIVKAVLVLSDQLGIGSSILAASAIAVGTSLPDIVVAIKVARKGRHMLLIGHILQSNIFDVFLIMGLCGLFVPLPVGDATARITILFATAFTISLVPIFRTRKIQLPVGILLFLSFLAFITILY